MADGYIQVPPDSTGKKIDTSEITVGANTVERHRVNITDPVTASAMAPVTSSGGLGVTILAGAGAGSTVVSLSSAIAISSGTITLSSVHTITATAATNPWSSAPSFNVPIVSASSGLVQISGTASVLSASSGQVGVFASTSRQYLVFAFNSSSSNSFTTVTTAPAVFYGWNVGNQGTSLPASIKIFNTSSGTAGSTAQLQVTIPIPGGSAGAGNNFLLPQGVSCTGGISFLITANFAATSTGPVAADDVVGSLYYNT